LPLARRRHATLGICAAFAGSTALHFWFAWVPLDLVGGSMMASFFVIHGAAMLLERQLGARGETHRGSSRRDFRRGREAETQLYRAYCKFRRQSPRRKDQARCREGFHHGLLGAASWPRGVGRAWTLAWLLLPSPLFIEPALRMLAGFIP
jgi:hypothetical protein